MNKKLLSALFGLALMAPATQAIADSIFYSGGQTGAWDVFGNSGNSTQNPACVAETKWEDGSSMQLIKDLKTGEVYIWFQNYEWNIGDQPGEYQFRLNLYNRAGNVVGGNMNYQLINKNTIAIRALDVNTFVPAFMEMSQMRIIMPGDIGNANIPLDGSTAAIEKLIACMDQFKKTPAPDAGALNEQLKTDEQKPKVPGQDI